MKRPSGTVILGLVLLFFVGAIILSVGSRGASG